VNQLISYLNKFLGTDITPEYSAERVGDVKHSLADISLAKRLIGYEPQVSFVHGLRKAVEWYKMNL